MRPPNRKIMIMKITRGYNAGMVWWLYGRQCTYVWYGIGKYGHLLPFSAQLFQRKIPCNQPCSASPYTRPVWCETQQLCVEARRSSLSRWISRTSTPTRGRESRNPSPGSFAPFELTLLLRRLHYRLVSSLCVVWLSEMQEWFIKLKNFFFSLLLMIWYV